MRKLVNFFYAGAFAKRLKDSKQPTISWMLNFFFVIRYSLFVIYI